MINNKIAEAAHWRDVATSTTAYSDGERVQASGSQQKMADAVCKYVEIEDEINEEIDRLVSTRRWIISTIEQLQSVDEYEVLNRHYVLFKDFTQIAEELDKSYSAITTIHGRALINLQKILDEMEKKNE